MIGEIGGPDEAEAARWCKDQHEEADRRLHRRRDRAPGQAHGPCRRADQRRRRHGRRQAGHHGGMRLHRHAQPQRDGQVDPEELCSESGKRSPVRSSTHQAGAPIRRLPSVRRHMASGRRRTRHGALMDIDPLLWGAARSRSPTSCCRATTRWSSRWLHAAAGPHQQKKATASGGGALTSSIGCRPSWRPEMLRWPWLKIIIGGCCCTSASACSLDGGDDDEGDWARIVTATPAWRPPFAPSLVADP